MNPSLAITVSASGANLASGAASANITIPNASSGAKPRFIRVHVTAAAYVKLGPTSGVTAAVGDMLIDPSRSEIISTLGHTYIAAIQVASAGIVNVTPLED